MPIAGIRIEPGQQRARHRAERVDRVKQADARWRTCGATAALSSGSVMPIIAVGTARIANDAHQARDRQHAERIAPVRWSAT